MQVFDLDESVVFDSIYPRCYYLCRGRSEMISFIEKYETTYTKSLINRIGTFDQCYLYMPTWRNGQNDSFIQDAGFDFDDLNRILRERNAIFLFKLHPAVKIVWNNEADLSNIVFLDKNMDIYPILYFVSTLITDYSSIYYDYLLLDRNIILFPFDKQEYISNSDDLVFDYDKYTPGIQVRTIRDLLSILSSDINCKVPNRDWIVSCFWGRSDIGNLTPLYNEIKALQEDQFC